MASRESDLVTKTECQMVHRLTMHGDHEGSSQLQCEPWITLKSQDFKHLPRNAAKYDGFVSISQQSPSTMDYIRQWLAGTINRYSDLSSVPKECLATLIEEADVRFCIEYHDHIYKQDSNAAILLHRRRLREIGGGYSAYSTSASKVQQIAVPTQGNQETNQQNTKHQQRASEGGTSNTGSHKSRKTRAKSPYDRPHKREPEDVKFSKAMFPPAKKQKKDPGKHLQKSTGKAASNGGSISVTQRLPRAKVPSQQPRSTNEHNTIHNTSGRQTRSQTNAHTLPAAHSPGSKISVQHAPLDDNKKRKASDSEKRVALPTKRLKKGDNVVKSELEVDSLPSALNTDMSQSVSDRTLHSAQILIPSFGGSVGSVSVVRNKKRKSSMRQNKIHAVACNADTVKDTAELPPTLRPSELQQSVLDDGKLTAENSRSCNSEPLQAILSTIPERISANPGVVTLPQSDQTTKQEQPIVADNETSRADSLDKAQEMPSCTLDNGAEPAHLQTYIPTPPTEKGSIVDSAITAPENPVLHGDFLAEISALTPNSTTEVSDSSLNASDSTVVSISNLALSIGQPLSLLEPAVIPLLTLGPVKIEDATAEGTGAGFGSTGSPLLHDVHMTDTQIAAIFEPVIDEDCIPRFPRAPLEKYPPIWSESRQELCESFDWFRSYQGGVYFTGGAVKGYLLSAFGAKRDFFKHEGKLIVSHGGGRAESLHSTKGNIATVAASDQQADDKSVRALRYNYIQQRPLALVIDEKYPFFPQELTAYRNVTYAVLGFYTIAHMWAEYQHANNENGRVVRYKFAFRWCDSQGAPWWTTPNEAECPINVDQEIPQKTSATEPDLVIGSCIECQKESKQVYSLCWACLNPDCKRFWRRSDGSFLPEQLSYHPGFLTLPLSVPVPANFKLKPVYPIPFNKEKAIAIVATAPTSYPFTRGFHCISCGRLSCRSQWAKWECLNCSLSLTIIGKVRQAKEFWGKNIISTAFRDNYVNKISGIKRLPAQKFDTGKGLLGNVQTFILPHGRGRIHHIQPGSPMGAVEADKIFEDYQTQAAKGELLFRRWPLKAHKCRGTLLTNYFSQNTGQPYQYVGGDAHTVPFSDAPSAILAARDLLQTRVKRALGLDDAAFNEVLSAAYMEKQKMAFHSDNEAGLGPLVAGLSMGAAAMMHFRLLAKYDPERRQRGILLSFTLRHGDILVMDGSDVQKFYEHTVVPTNFRIAATARQITPAHR